MMVLYFKCAEIAPQLCSRINLPEQKNNQIANCGVEMRDVFVTLKFFSEDVIPPLRLERQLPSQCKWKNNFFEETLLYWSTQLGSGEAQGTGLMDHSAMAFFTTERAK
jgi:hypothetical protein